MRQLNGIEIITNNIINPIYPNASIVQTMVETIFFRFFNNNKKKMADQGKEVSKEEKALYDRQIRLWGLSAQKRMGSSKILVYSFSGVNCEIIKNIVLAGIGEVKIWDEDKITPAHLSANFFLREEDLGKNIAEMAAPRVNELNERVKIITDNRPISALSSLDVAQYDVILIGDRAPLSELFRINALTHSENKLFLCGGVRGMYGFFFSDVANYTYTPKASDDKEKQEKQKEQELTKKVQGATLESTFNIFSALRKRTQGGDSGLSKYKRVDPLFWAFGIMYKYKDSQTTESIEDFTNSNHHQLLTAQGRRAPLKIEEIQSLSTQWNSELAPCCAILGGIIGQEILKLVGHEEEPILNTFLFNGLKSTCMVEKLPL